MITRRPALLKREPSPPSVTDSDDASAREPAISRRRLLRAGPGLAGALVLAGSASASAARVPSPRATTSPRPAAPRPSGKPPAPGGLRPLKEPVFTLKDYRRVLLGRAFPSDAVALTIDDGPHPVWTPKILRLLDQHHVPALFCMIGNQVLGHEAVARSVVRDGHQVANHTWSHPTEMGRRPQRHMRRELTRAQEKIYDTTGYAPTLFRSPGGDWSPALLRAAAKARMVPLDWSDDPRDWSRPGAAAITRRLLAARPGQILLCHDGGGDRSQTYTALRTVIPALQARGYRFVALDHRHPQGPQFLSDE
jgi:peptidoglycan/xylan/chitin deacetylase (PgdA/CDA1 family)